MPSDVGSGPTTLICRSLNRGSSTGMCATGGWILLYGLHFWHTSHCLTKWQNVLSHFGPIVPSLYLVPHSFLTRMIEVVVHFQNDLSPLNWHQWPALLPFEFSQWICTLGLNSTFSTVRDFGYCPSLFFQTSSQLSWSLAKALRSTSSSDTSCRLAISHLLGSPQALAWRRLPPEVHLVVWTKSLPSDCISH